VKPPSPGEPPVIPPGPDEPPVEPPDPKPPPIEPPDPRPAARAAGTDGPIAISQCGPAAVPLGLS
jgi:hypothetical protein